MERNLETCGRCRGACDSLKRTLALCRTSRSSAEVPASVRASVQKALRTVLAENV
jgi:RNA polymerase sigma-70 factor (ECF subfamily)